MAQSRIEQIRAVYKGKDIPRQKRKVRAQSKSPQQDNNFQESCQVRQSLQVKKKEMKEKIFQTNKVQEQNNQFQENLERKISYPSLISQAKNKNFEERKNYHMLSYYGHQRFHSMEPQ